MAPRAGALMAAEVHTVVPGAARLGEAPLWDASRSVLWWVDIEGGVLHRHDPSGGDAKLRVASPLAFAYPRAADGLVVGLRDRFAALDPETGALADLTGSIAGCGDRLNDAALDRSGRVLAGGMGEGAAFHTLHADHDTTCWRTGVRTANGLALSPNGQRLYFSDSHPDIRKVWSVPYDPDDGTVGPPELFLDTKDLPGRPDGGCVDADGCYWSALIGGGCIARVTPEGRIDRMVDLPTANPTKPAWGGADLDVLYVTSLSREGRAAADGGLYAITGLGACGLPETPYAG